MRNRLILPVVATVLVVASCGSGEQETDVTTDSTPTPSSEAAATTLAVESDATVDAAGVGTGCVELHQPGEYEGAGTFGEIDQPYWVVVPESYAEMAPVPLYLHLATGGGSHQDMMDGWRPYLDDLEALMVMVNTAEPGRGAPDALVSLVDHISSEYCVDPQRIYVMGTGSSFAMTENLACEYPDRIAAFAASFGTAGFACTPTQPVPLLSFTGDGDRSSVTALVGRWVAANGCDSDPLVEDLGSGVQRNTYQNCDADIVFYDIEGMYHAWPMHEAKGPGMAWIAEYEEVDYLEEAYKFFTEHELP